MTTRPQTTAQPQQPQADGQPQRRGQQQQPQENSSAGQADGQQQHRHGQGDGQRQEAEKAALPSAQEMQSYIMAGTSLIAVALRFGPRIAALAKEIFDDFRGSNPSYQQGGEDR
jgi:hypothetical protein